jgi:DnaK suppressor protein
MDQYTNDMAARFREDLVNRAMQLGQLLQQDVHAAEGNGVHEVGDFKDAAAEESIASIDNAQAAHAAVELAQVQAALRRIADGTYGECIDCGDPIDLRRLEALPATPYCAPCQSVHERVR